MLRNDSKLSQSLPDRVILGDVENDEDMIEMKSKDFLRKNSEGIHQSDIHRISYRRAIENFQLTPSESINTNINKQRKLNESGEYGESIVWNTITSDNCYSEDIFPIHMERRQSAQKNKHVHFRGNRALRTKRAISKSGRTNVYVKHIPERSRRFCKDFVTTLIEEQWRYVLFIFSIGYFGTWLLFALLWFLIGNAHGDNLVDPTTHKSLGDDPLPCIQGCESFSSYLLFSIETQVTIGFGTRYPNEGCPEAIFLMILQLIVGMLLQGSMVGIVFAKISRPRKTNFERKFAKKAVLCIRDGKLCLVFRIADPKHNHIIGTNVKAYWIEDKKTVEGEILKQYQYKLELENNGSVLVLWPQTIAHIIDERSPLYDLSAKDLLEKKFEIVLLITGSSRTKGQVEQSRTSYTPKEVCWGHRFRNMIKYDSERCGYIIEYHKFDETKEIMIPLCSAKRLDQVKNEILEVESNLNSSVQYCHYDSDFNFSEEDIIIDFDEDYVE